MRALPRIATSSLAVLILLPIVLAPTTNAPGEELLARAGPVTHRAVMGGVGTHGQSGAVEVYGTLAQPTPIGISTNSSHWLSTGFWTPGPRVVGVVPELARQTRLEQNFPNPFNPRTRIEYEIAHEGYVRLEVLNLRGERVRALVAHEQPIGRHHVDWDGRDDRGRDVSTGIYLYRLQVGEFATVKKMLLMK